MRSAWVECSLVPGLVQSDLCSVASRKCKRQKGRSWQRQRQAWRQESWVGFRVCRQSAAADTDAVPVWMVQFSAGTCSSLDPTLDSTNRGGGKYTVQQGVRGSCSINPNALNPPSPPPDSCQVNECMGLPPLLPDMACSANWTYLRGHAHEQAWPWRD